MKLRKGLVEITLEIRETGEFREDRKTPDTATTIVSLMTPRLEVGIPVRTDKYYFVFLFNVHVSS